MLIVCPSCATSYNVDPALMQPHGRQVRCVRCRTVWQAEPSRNEKPVVLAGAIASERRSSAALVEAAAGADAKTAAGAIAGVGDPPPRERATAAASLETDAVAPDPESDWVAYSAKPADETVTVEAPAIVPDAAAEVQPPVENNAHDEVQETNERVADIEAVAAARARRKAKRRSQVWRLSLLQSIVLGLLVVDSILIGWRKDVVRILPQTAPLYAAMRLPVNLSGLSFDHLTTRLESHDRIPILVVQGNIVNATGVIRDVPRLKLLIRNAAKQEVYTWTKAPPLWRLSPYQAVGFLTRLSSPPADGRDVLVRFFTRRDAVAQAP
jgi:predicted Zn finger-like uncharacterized protein